MKIWQKLLSVNQRGVISLHTILPIAVAVIAIGGVGSYVLQSSRAETPVKCYGVTLQKGTNNPTCVKQLQLLINAWDNRSGYDFLALDARVPTDGVFEAKTEAGLKAYQKREGMTVTGTATTSPTWQKICPATGQDSKGYTLPDSIKSLCATASAPTATPPPAPVLPVATYTCTNLKLVSGTVGYTASVKVKTASDVSKFTMIDNKGGAAIAATETGTIAAGATKTLTFGVKHVDGATLSVAYTGFARVVCATSSTATTTPGGAVSAANPATGSSGGSSATPGGADSAATPTTGTGATQTSGETKGDKNAPKPKVSDLGYTAKLHCVTKDRDTLTASSCSKSNALVLVIYGTESSPTKNLLSYNIGVVNKADKFGRVDGCAPRTIVRASGNSDYSCTVVYTDKGFFSSMKQTVTNRFKSIFGKAKADTFLNKSEAKAAVKKLRDTDSLTKATTISLSYKGYETQQINGNDLVFNYDESVAVERVKDLQESDCKTAGGSFLSYSEGCDLPSAAATSTTTTGTASTVTSTGFTKVKCAALNRVWADGTCVKRCDPASYKIVTDEPYDVCVKPSKTKPSCKSTQRLKDLGSDGWACVNVTTTAGTSTASSDSTSTKSNAKNSKLCAIDGGIWKRSLRHPFGTCVLPALKPACTNFYVLQSHSTSWTVRANGVDMTKKVTIPFEGKLYTCYFDGIADIGDTGIPYVGGPDFTKPSLSR